MAAFLIITGHWGAGRSEAAKHLEDLGWFVIDNLPPELIPNVAELAMAPGSANEHVGLVVGPGQRSDVADTIRQLRETPGLSVSTLFLQAAVQVLVQRYETTRRRHPFKHTSSLAEAIAAESEALDSLRAEADVIIDTSELNVHQLRDRIVELFTIDASERRMRTRIVSFGYKHGVPLDVDLVFDCRFLPNPHWVEELRPLTGQDAPVKEYVLGQPQAEQFLEILGDLLGVVMPAYAEEGKSYLTIAFGCTGGQHRSVAIAERVSALLETLGITAGVTHRDMPVTPSN